MLNFCFGGKINLAVISITMKRDPMDGTRGNKYSKSSSGPKIEPCGTAHDREAEDDSELRRLTESFIYQIRANPISTTCHIIAMCRQEKTQVQTHRSRTKLKKTALLQT